MASKGSSGRIEEYVEESAEAEEVQKTEIPKQFEFYKVPKRFGSIPVDELPLGCDKDEQYHKIYPRLSLPFQKADRISFGSPKLEPNRLFWGDNMHVMRMLPSESIDLIYIDPPFFSGRDYNFIFGDQNEVRSFTDIWEGGMPGYLIWLNARLLEMKRLLRKNGTLYVHLDYHASHYVKVELDKIFGYDNFVSEIYWYYYNKMHDYRKKVWPKATDTILMYAKERNSDYVFNLQEEKRETPVKQLKRKKVDGRMVNVKDEAGHVVYQLRDKRAVDNVWRISTIQPADRYQRVGYPTQKPEALLRRIILGSSNPNDVVADFFCGGGTTPVVAQELRRRWIGCDSSRIAIAITLDRLMRFLNSSAKDIQTSLGPVPDISVEHWGIYEIPALTQLSQDEFVHFIISAYNGRVATGGTYIHGFKSGIPLFVGPASQDYPVKKGDVIEFAREVTTKRGLKRGDMLAWAFSPSAQEAASRLTADGTEVDLIRLKLIRIDSEQFREHVTSKHKEYERLLTFILPPEVRLTQRRLAPLTYVFDIGESISVNPGGKIANVQWDFDFQGTFVSTPGYSFIRDANNAPVFKISYEFDRPGKHSIACRVQDDLGGEKTRVEVVAVQ
jgi:DNA modification methylase